jgi:hypothetical protein
MYRGAAQQRRRAVHQLCPVFQTVHASMHPYIFQIIFINFHDFIFFVFGNAGTDRRLV